MDANKIFGILVIALLFLGALLLLSSSESHAEEQPMLKNFSSCEELKAYLKENTVENRYGYHYDVGIGGMVYKAMQVPMAAEESTASDSAASDYSTTNIQVEGVDEADIVKTDGRYIYVISGNELVIVDAYPAENAEVLSRTRTMMQPTELFVNGDKLVLFGGEYQETSIKIYDISDRENPELEESLSAEGYYFDSRMIDDYVYVIVNEPIYRIEDVEMPVIEYKDGENKTCGCGEVYYFDEPSYQYSFSTVISIDIVENEVSSKVFLTGSSENLYVSQDNIYVVHTTPRSYSIPVKEVVSEVTGVPIPPPSPEKTMIHRLSIDEGEVEYEAKGEVPGHVLNQFSMDEHDGYFRIATTIGHVARFAEEASSKNNVYVLDEDLEVVGSLEDLAPGERIYSARFMGKRCYLVTFRKVDPLFVIDLADPENPEVLGKLKIPGYSDYLHPYDENHLIGLGKETVPAEEGDFSWYQGVKLSLFDVSDVEHPREVAKYEIGDRGTDSYALHDHKAFLFSRSKNLLVIPVLLAEIDEDRYAGDLPPTAHGDYTFQGAYVFHVSPETGFRLDGRVTHLDDDNELLKSGYYFDSQYSVKRSLYIEEVLYTISEEKIKMNDLSDLEEINEVELS